MKYFMGYMPIKVCTVYCSINKQSPWPEPTREL
jgi:hypothetical protein